MITLDDFMPVNAKRNKGDPERHNKIQGITRREITLDDLPHEIRRDPRKFIEKVKKLDLTVDQKILVEMIEKGTTIHKIGIKKQKISGLEPYSSYLLLKLYQGIKKQKFKEAKA
jgi:hypothetical protein